ncbi:MAG: hypothetical protein ACI83P_001893 [Janthinobacterium sp.]|jgi:hypothetical protein
MSVIFTVFSHPVHSDESDKIASFGVVAQAS